MRGMRMTSCYTPDRIPGGVAESADAPDLKSGGRKVVWVRVPPPLLAKNYLQDSAFFRRRQIAP